VASGHTGVKHDVGVINALQFFRLVVRFRCLRCNASQTMVLIGAVIFGTRRYPG
jgi:hypothetical protein